MTTVEPSPGRLAARARILVLGAALALVFATTACESTTHLGHPPAQSSAPSGQNSGSTAAPTGPPRILVEIANDRASVDRERSILARIADHLNSGRPAGAAAVEIDVRTAEELRTNPARACQLFTAETSRPRAMISVNGAITDCPEAKGVAVVVPEPMLVPARTAEAAQLIMPRGVTVEEFSAAMAAYLETDASAARAQRLAVIASPAMGVDDKLWKASADKLAATISRRLGKPVSAYLLPFSDSPSYAAETLALPVRLRKDGVGAIVVLGGNDPLPAEQFAGQRFTPPLFGSPSVFLGEVVRAGYPASQVKGLINGREAPEDPSVGAVQDRQTMRMNPAGRTCLRLIDAAGRRAPETAFFDLAPVCEQLQLLRAALDRDPAAFESAAALRNALSLLGPIELARGGRADFTGGRRAGAVALSVANGEPSCSCVRETDRSYPLDAPAPEPS